MSKKNTKKVASSEETYSINDIFSLPPINNSDGKLDKVLDNLKEKINNRKNKNESTELQDIFQIIWDDCVFSEIKRNMKKKCAKECFERFYADVLLNVYIHYKWSKTEKTISFAKLIEKQSELLDEKINRTTISKQLSQIDFYNKHPYAYYFGVENHEDNKKHNFKECFLALQIILMNHVNESLVCITDKTNRKKCKESPIFEDIYYNDTLSNYKKRGKKIKHYDLKSIQEILIELREDYNKIKETIKDENHIVTLYLMERIMNAQTFYNIADILSSNEYNVSLDFETVLNIKNSKLKKHICEEYNKLLVKWKGIFEVLSNLSQTPFVFFREVFLDQSRIRTDSLNLFEYGIFPFVSRLFYDFLSSYYNEESIESKLLSEIHENKTIKTFNDNWEKIFDIKLDAVSDESSEKDFDNIQSIMERLYSNYLKQNERNQLEKESEKKKFISLDGWNFKNWKGKLLYHLNDIDEQPSEIDLEVFVDADYDLIERLEKMNPIDGMNIQECAKWILKDAYSKCGDELNALLNINHYVNDDNNKKVVNQAFTYLKDKGLMEVTAVGDNRKIKITPAGIDRIEITPNDEQI